jgi:hypothetical protein
MATQWRGSRRHGHATAHSHPATHRADVGQAITAYLRVINTNAADNPVAFAEVRVEFAECT